MLKKVIQIIVILNLSFHLNAMEFKPIGFKAVGMGGAGVASTKGSLSGYYNPALLNMHATTTGFSINTGIHIKETSLINNMEELEDINIEASIDTIGENIENKNIRINALDDGTNIILSNGITLPSGILNNGDQLTILNRAYVVKIENGILTLESQGTQGNSEIVRNNITKALDLIINRLAEGAAKVEISPSFTAQINQSFAVGVYTNFGYSLRMNFSKDHDQLIIKDGNSYYEYNPTTDFYEISIGDAAQSKYESSSLEYALENDNSIDVIGSLFTEIPISYAKSYDWDNSGYWSFGINVKPMLLRTILTSIRFGQSQDVAEDLLDTEESVKYKSTIGFDFGMAFNPKGYDLITALVIKNLNSPKFKVDSDPTNLAKDIKIEPSVRAGINIPFFDNTMNFAFDVDLTKNETIIGDKSQYFGGGIEYEPSSWVTFRFGVMQDMASEIFDYGTILTGGFGIGFKWLELDLSINQSMKNGTYDGREIPRYGLINFSLVSQWGSVKN